MIARIWRGITQADKADDYLAYLQETGLKDYANTSGNRGVTVLRRVQGEHCEFMLVSLWDSMDAVRAFAGENPDKSVYYPEDDRYLLDMERGCPRFCVNGPKAGNCHLTRRHNDYVKA